MQVGEWLASLILASEPLDRRVTAPNRIRIEPVTPSLTSASPYETAW